MSDISPKPVRRDREAGQPHLSDAARRALAEAEERRRCKQPSPAQVEVGGRGGLDPNRFGDWEVKGLTSDF